MTTKPDLRPTWWERVDDWLDSGHFPFGGDLGVAMNQEVFLEDSKRGVVKFYVCGIDITRTLISKETVTIHMIDPATSPPARQSMGLEELLWLQKHLHDEGYLEFASRWTVIAAPAL
jgi:hypothetical protein